MTPLSILVAILVQRKFMIKQNRYQYCILKCNTKKENIYRKAPEGFSNNKKLLLETEKGLSMGWKQAVKGNGNNELKQHIKQNKFLQAKKEITCILSRICTEYNIDLDIGEIDFVIGIKFEKRENTVTFYILHQKEYIKEIFDPNPIEDSKLRKIPCDETTYPTKVKEPKYGGLGKLILAHHQSIDTKINNDLNVNDTNRNKRNNNKNYNNKNFNNKIHNDYYYDNNIKKSYKIVNHKNKNSSLKDIAKIIITPEVFQVFKTVNNTTIKNDSVENISTYYNGKFKNNDIVLLNVYYESNIQNNLISTHSILKNGCAIIMKRVNNKDRHYYNNNTKDFIIIEHTKNRTDKNCRQCKITKLKRKPFNSSPNNAIKPMELVHSDVAGKLETSYNDFNYYMRMVQIFIHSVPGNSHQNGSVERLNQTLNRCVSTLLNSPKLSSKPWDSAILSAAYLYNFLSTSKFQGFIK
ncbi:hypothetical protein H8356DRAFT_1323584 [Neocallimastix lanati (nom. inval.)]|nr:hypothetical protein H8356DRAFT_1323584 [Neocallimastix sp. JGI-2020a]